MRLLPANSLFFSDIEAQKQERQRGNAGNDFGSSRESPNASPRALYVEGAWTSVKWSKNFHFRIHFHPFTCGRNGISPLLSAPPTQTFSFHFPKINGQICISQTDLKWNHLFHFKREGLGALLPPALEKSALLKEKMLPITISFLLGWRERCPSKCMWRVHIMGWNFWACCPFSSSPLLSGLTLWSEQHALQFGLSYFNFFFLFCSTFLSP